MIFQLEEILKIVDITYALWLVYFYASTVKVIHISDGDGFKAKNIFNKLVIARLSGVDAPEVSQPHGEEAKQSLASRIFGKRVWIKKKTTDKYGRSVCKVSDIWGDVCAHQVFWGHAWNYEEYGGRYYFHEWFARGGWCFGWFRQGLWKQENPIPPWEWRKKDKGKVVQLPVKKKAKRK